MMTSYWDTEELIDRFPRRGFTGGEVRIYRVSRRKFYGVEVRITRRDRDNASEWVEIRGVALTEPEWNELFQHMRERRPALEAT